MNIFDSISNVIKNRFDKGREQREMMEGLQKEADAQRLMAFKDAFSENAKIVAIAQAKRDAAELSGLQKLRAANRSRNLSGEGPEPGTFFEKLSDFTKKNKARMQNNLEHTAKMRAIGQQEKGKSATSRTSKNNGRREPFGKSNWKL